MWGVFSHLIVVKLLKELLHTYPKNPLLSGTSVYFCSLHAPHSANSLPSGYQFGQNSEWASCACGWPSLYNIPQGQGSAETSSEICPLSSFRISPKSIQLMYWLPKTIFGTGRKITHTRHIQLSALDPTAHPPSLLLGVFSYHGLSTGRIATASPFNALTQELEEAHELCDPSVCCYF